MIAVDLIAQDLKQFVVDLSPVGSLKNKDLSK